MSEFIDSCEYVSIEQIIRLLIFCNDNDNKYLNSCNSELNPDDLLPVDCDYKSIRGMLKQVFDQDNAGNPCVSFCSTDNDVFFCNNELDFRFSCNSQYLSIV